MNAVDGPYRNRLILLIEECGEVIQAATKILRFGRHGADPVLGRDNVALLEEEIGHVANAVDLLTLDCGLSAAHIASARAEKRRVMQAATEAVPQYDFIHDTAEAEA